MKEVCTLLPTTKRYKEVIKEYGKQWYILKRSLTQIPELNGICVLIESFDKTHKRWVTEKDIIIVEKK